MNTRITGGIVTYNNADIIEKCIRSILKYTNEDIFTLYVYDNHSGDNTVDIIKKNFPQVHVIEGPENRGFGFGHNQLVKHRTSDYHVIINPDIFLTDNVIEKMAMYMDENSDVVQLTTEVRNMDGSVQYLPKEDPCFRYVVLSKLKPFAFYRKAYTRENEEMTGPTQVMSGTGCFSMVRTKSFKQIHGYDPQFFLYFEDADLSRRLRALGRIIYHPGMWVYHAWKRDNTKSLKGIRIFLTSMLKYQKKWR